MLPPYLGSPFTLFLSVLSFFTVYLIASAIYNLYLSPLSRFPGPKTWAVSRIPYLQEMQNGNLVHRIKELHEKYGEIVRIAPNELSYISASAWHDIYGHHPGRGTIPKWGYGVVPTGVHSIFTADDSEHSRYRRLLARGFSDKALRDMEPILQKHTDELVSSFRKQISHSDTGSAVVNLVNWYSFTGYDITSELTFGESFNCIRSARSHPWNSMLYEHLEALSWFASFRYLSFPSMERVLQHVLPKSVTQRRQVHFGLTRELVHKRLETPAEAGGSHQPKEDLVAHMLRNGGDANNKGMSVPELEANINDLLLAGTETSSTALTGITNLLLQNPRELNALVDEIRTAFPHESDITSSAVHELRHLGAVIEEGLRLAPPVPEGLARIIAPEGQFIAGHWIPGGTHVSAPQYATNRSHLHFASPSAFLPSRWLPPNPPASSSPAFNPFSLGPRNCIGKNVAYSEMRLVLAKLLWAFDLEWEGEAWDWECQKTYALFPLWDKRALRVRVRRRGGV